MGNENAHPPVNPRSSFFALKLKYGFMTDSICITYHQDEVADIIRNTLRKIIPKGTIEEDRLSPTQLKLKLSGDAVREFANSDTSYQNEYCLATILNDLLIRGWRCQASVNLSLTSKNCFLFFCKDPQLPLRPSECPILAVRLHSTDKLHLVNAEQALKDLVRSQVECSWSKGIQSFEDCNDTECKFKLNGNPWAARSFGEELKEGRLLMLNVIQALHEKGCEYYVSCHPGESIVAVDTIFFTRHREVAPLGESFILGLLKSNEIYLVRAPSQVVDIVRNCILVMWPDGISSERDLPGLVVFKLKHSPWVVSLSGSKLKQSDANARQLVAKMFQQLRMVGWRVHATLDLFEDLDDVSCFMMTQCLPETNQYMVVSLHGEHHIRLLNAPQSVVSLLTDELPKEFPQNFLVGKEILSCAEIVLPNEFKRSVELFCIVLDRLKTRGWELVSSADLSANFVRTKNSRFPIDLHTLILEYRPPKEAPPPSYNEAMAFVGDSVAPSAPPVSAYQWEKF